MTGCFKGVNSSEDRHLVERRHSEPTDSDVLIMAQQPFRKSNNVTSFCPLVLQTDNHALSFSLTLPLPCLSAFFAFENSCF